ncbi:MAG: hypothetical protein PHE17_14925 [Thiothrix sp.]|uniref:hypothetical protein n=1 Tax=Thiothrix sp. TaxID=1032 RepID=UPI00262BD9C8|nr:hypothetical protein [Thiothrix sp.]MDD5394305.1 hypothetical protein [Thiothrix sp.]
MTPTELLNQQLEAMMATLAEIPETDMPGNAAHYLNRLVRLVANNGVDEPMVTSYWYTEDFDSVLEDRGEECPIDRGYARKLFALIDRTHNAEIGINWDVLKCALDEGVSP